MGLFDKFPWTDEHQLNLNWILRILKQLQGGTVDQVLTRKSNKPFDFGWKTMSGGGGGGGTTDYDELGNKPQINNVTLKGNKSLLDLGIINRFPGLNLPKMNSSSPSAGGSARYSPEDHVHPSDTSRTTPMQVSSMITSALAWYDPASKSFNPPYNAGTIGKAIEDALSVGVTPEAIQDAVDAYLDDHPALTGMFTNAAKSALIALLEKVAYVDGNGQQYLDDLITNLAATVTSISAVFTQGANIIYDTDSLDTLRQYLVVTASYSDGTSATVANYELTGSLTAGTSSITVSYADQTDTFTVTVTGTIKLENGTHTFSDGSTLTILDNHVTVFLKTSTPGSARFVNISKASENTSNIFSNSNVNNKPTTFATFETGDEVHLDITNATSDNTSWVSGTNDYDVAINLRKQNASTSVLSNGITIRPSNATPASAGGQITDASAINTIAQDVTASCAILYIPGGYPANTTLEFDFRLYVE